MVPDTNTFALSDVVTEIVPSVNSLSQCFAESIDWKFDPAYKGDKDRLSNFRNYGGLHTYTAIIELNNAKTNTVFAQADYSYQWNSIITSTAGTSVGLATGSTGNYLLASTYDPVTNGGQYTHPYWNSRMFLSFDLSSIPVGATLNAAKVTIPVLEQTGGQEVSLTVGYVTQPYDIYDYDAYGDYLGEGSYSIKPLVQGYPLWNYTGGYYDEAIFAIDSVNLPNISDYFGGDFYIAFRNFTYDASGSGLIPTDHNNYKVLKATNSNGGYPPLPGYIYKAELEITFTIP